MKKKTKFKPSRQKKQLPRNKKPFAAKMAGAALASMMLLSNGAQIVQMPDGSTLINPNVASAATLSSSVDPANLNIPGFENAQVIDMTKYAGTEASEQFHDALQKSIDGPIILDVGDGNYKFDSTHNIEVIGSKGVYIRGNGATIDYLNAKTTNLPEFYAFQFHMKKGDNVGVHVEGVTFDGHRNEQDLFFTFNDTVLNGYGGDVSGFYKTRLAKGLNISGAENISIHDTNFKNAYGGYSIQASDYRKVNIENVKIDNVGGDGQTDSLGMFLYFGGHSYDDAEVNINNVIANGKMGDKPQSNSGTGYKNAGDPSYTSWIGVVTGENGTIQNTDKSQWLVDGNTTFNITNSEFNNVETTFHTESMAGNVALNVNNVKTLTKQLSITAGIKGRFEGTFNKMNIEQLPYGRNSTYSSLFSSEFGDDPRYHDGYNANITDGKGGPALHHNTLTNSYVNGLIREKTPVGAPGSADVYASLAYGNMVNVDVSCTQFDNVWNKLYANGGGTITDSTINLWENNPNEPIFESTATEAGIKGSPGREATIDDKTTINDAGAWKTQSATCEAPTFYNFSNLEAPPVLDDPAIPSPIGGGTPTNPTDPVTPIENNPPKIEAPDVTITEGDTFDPMQGVSVTDDKDTAPITPEVSGTVDVNKPGTYTLTYTATDADGAKATKERVVTVKAKDAPTTEQPTTEQPTTEQPTTTEEPTTEQPTTEQPTTTEEPTTEQPTTEQPTTEQPTTEQPTTEQPTTEQPTTEQPTTEQPTTEQPTGEQPPVTDVKDAKPRIIANDQYILEGTEFDAMSDVWAYDETGDLTSDVKLKSGSVDTAKPGKYDLTYEVTDAQGNKVERTITITVGKDHQKAIDSLNTLVDKLQKDVKDLDTRVTALEGKVKDAETKVADLENRIKTIEEQIKAAQDQLKVINEQIKALEERADASDKAIADLKAKAEQIQKDIDGLKEDVKDLQDQMNKAKEDITGLKDGVDDANSKIDDIDDSLNKPKELPNTGGNGKLIDRMTSVIYNIFR